MEILERIEAQIAANKLPLFAVTVAAVPCPDTPVILTLHWHGFVRERLVEIEEAEAITYIPIPSSALQVNDRWTEILDLDRAAMEAGWELGAWDVARAERPSCTVLAPTRARHRLPQGVRGIPVRRSTASNQCSLMRPMLTISLDLAGRRGYLMWLFRPVRGGIWGEVANDATLLPGGTREPPARIRRFART